MAEPTTFNSRVSIFPAVILPEYTSSIIRFNSLLIRLTKFGGISAETSGAAPPQCGQTSAYSSGLCEGIIFACGLFPNENLQ
ncbi:MAG: hypothetical protein IMY72_11805 [Bacteroidetes bacterium]|nr:hypothetical protein [Bacteroidota bacterium]